MNQATIQLIKEFESLHDGNLKQIGLQPKMDPVGIWTEGYGRAMIDPRTKRHLRGNENKQFAEAHQTIKTEAEAEQALNEDLGRYATMAANALGADGWSKLNENQRGALTSFVYNCGTGDPEYKIFGNIRKFLASKLTQASLTAYWQKSVITSGGKKLAGLVRRRAAESVLFFSRV